MKVFEKLSLLYYYTFILYFSNTGVNLTVVYANDDIQRDDDAYFYYENQDPLWKAAKNDNGHYYKDKYFAKGEGQSCSDISAQAEVYGSYAFVKFCILNNPDFNVSTTLSFWAWDQNNGLAPGIVRLYYTPTIGNRTLISSINVRGFDETLESNVRFFRREFTLANLVTVFDPNAKFHLYYACTGNLDIRDVSCQNIMLCACVLFLHLYLL